LVGYVTAENGTDSNSYYAVAIDSQDRIIVVGFTDAPDERGLIVRYLPSGALDEAFNSGGTPGYITINSQGIDECYGLTIDSLDSDYCCRPINIW
jgi:hypothetical protein